MHVKNKSKRISDDLKAEIIKASRIPGCIVSKVAKNYNISPNLLYAWRSKNGKSSQQEVLSEAKIVNEGNFVELWVYPLVAYIVLYAIPYGFFFFVCCKDYLEKGNYKTMFEDNKNAPGIKQFLALGGSGFQELKYCIVHALSCSLAFFLGPLLWHSFALHTIYLCLIILGATMRGSAYYNRVFGKIKAKEYLEQKEAEEANKGDE